MLASSCARKLIAKTDDADSTNAISGGMPPKGEAQPADYGEGEQSRRTRRPAHHLERVESSDGDPEQDIAVPA